MAEAAAAAARVRVCRGDGFREGRVQVARKQGFANAVVQGVVGVVDG